jgi:glutamate dehydrogenase
LREINMAKKARPTSSPSTAELEKLLIAGALPGELEGFGRAERGSAAAFVAATAARRPSGKPALALETMTSGTAWRAMRIAIINDDMPFLVDSIAAEIAGHGLSAIRLLHPVIHVERDVDGKLISVQKKRTAQTRRESIIYLEVDRADARERRAIEASIKSVLASVRAAVIDWHKMQSAMRVDAGALASEEGAALLHWFGDNNFTMLGHALFLKNGGMAASLGIAGLLGERLLSRQARKRAFDWFAQFPDMALILKSNEISPVHSRVPLELIIVPRLSKGRITQLSLHAGLWTSAALTTPAEDIPVLRKRLINLQSRFGFDPTGHAGKALAHAFTLLPNDLLIAMDHASAEAVSLAAMSITDRPRPRLAMTKSPLGRHVHAFVWIPRDDLSTSRREAIAAKLCDAAEAPLLSWSLDLDEGGVALLRYTLDIRDGGDLPDATLLNAWLENLLRGWRPSLEEALALRGESSTKLAMRFADVFPQNYRDTTPPADAAEDVLRLHALTSDTAREARLFLRDGALRLKLYSQTPVILSDAVPTLENFGFQVIEELPTQLAGPGTGHIHDFGIALPDTAEIGTLIDNRDGVERAIASVLRGEAENDRFNLLMATSGLDARAVILLRALFRYLRQTGLAYGLLTVVDALRKSPTVTRALVALFGARHDPGTNRDDKAEGEAAKAIDRGLAAITAIDDDRILRQFRAVIMATLRTNMFTPSAAEAIAFKIDSARVPGLPAPLPWREIFVYSPRVEGIHLRAGPVARGGLRWSDRRDDFRTEVLGLMKAQRVKNAVIVPTGAKGGFYPKLLPDPAHREAWLAEGTESYRIFIRTLLSVTDNLVNGKVVHPAGVVCHDADDPYFVVAADKGTATFSDVANAIALERGFWLGDAFASGGSVGYDHKAMGITAKGGWISVKRHFAEMGVDIQKEPVRVAGCGDMSGDVFGNGMLLSKAIKLVAAFDHRHIFFDPDPDPAKSWKERDRMFKLPRSSWADYDARLISKGGGVFPRTAKSIKLSKEMRAVVGTDAAEMEPSALIAAILKAPVGLLWFGGIGTYVKARAESNSEVGDRANDAHRVNAEDLACKVIGEGANLGMTQDARIAFGLRGGRSNTDFIDNSAGVDCSDHEVNIKIALNAEVASGKLGMKARNALLARMTGDVAALVLEDNRLQTLALSIAERDGAGDLAAHIRIIENFEASGKLDRAVEGIAANDELLRRIPEGKGLTRPELAVLLATAKLAFQAGIEATRLGLDPATHGDLMEAFPLEMQRRHVRAIENHRLRGEIIATKLANRIVNRMGIVHPFELAEEEGATLGDVAEAFVIAEQLYGLPTLWEVIDGADMSETTRLMLFEQVAVEMRAHMADILRNSIESRSNDKAVAAYAPMLKRLSDARESLLPEEARRQTEAFGVRLVSAGTPRKIADQLVRLAQLDGAIGLAALSARKGIDVIALTHGFTALGEALGLDWAQGVAMQLDPQDPWERLLAAGLARDFQAMRLDFIDRQSGKNPAEGVARWTNANAERVRAFRAMIDRARLSGVPTPAMLAQIAGQARVLLGR